ncbi:MAG: 2-C-methyl-D-erythritol 4-phosphate cytidylyltransferase, partial [Bacteroidaceae bacterium]|nr:2-C-methyl-D-erythritol 4-phosphate cytidylyltransferase [Bacteroidaceae bacterium]
MEKTKVIAILLAGGSGSRFGADRPKQFLEVNGCT